MVRQCCLVVHRSFAVRLPFVCRYSARDMGARASDRPSDRASLVRLIKLWSLPRGWSVADLSVRLSSATRQSARPSLVRRCPVSSGHGRCSVRLLLVAALPLLCRSSVVGQGRSSVSTCIIGLPVPLPLLYSAALLGYSTRLLGCSTARLLYCSAALPLYSAALPLYCSATLLGYSTRLLYRSTARLLYSAALPLGCSATQLLRSPPCAHSYSICWLGLAATLFTHTLFHAWCPVTLLSLIRCSTVVVTAAASCRRAPDSIARCIVAARLPPSVTSVTVPTDCSFLAVQRLNAVPCTALHSSTHAHSKEGFCVVVSSFWSPSSVVVVRSAVIAASRVFRHG